MKYIIRIIALPFWFINYLIFAIYRVILGLFKLSYGFVVYGGEQITYDHTFNRNTIFRTYLKVEEIELNLKVDPRSNCNHVWEQEVDYDTATAIRQKCVICGVQNTIKNF